MLHRCVQAKFLVKHEKFTEHASKIFTKHPCIMQNFSKLQKILEKHLTILQKFSKCIKKIPKGKSNIFHILTNSLTELAMNFCAPVHNLSDPEKLSTRIIAQLVLSEDTSFTEQNTSSSFPCTIEIILFCQYFTEIMKIRPELF